MRESVGGWGRAQGWSPRKAGRGAPWSQGAQPTGRESPPPGTCASGSRELLPTPRKPHASHPGRVTATFASTRSSGYLPLWGRAPARPPAHPQGPRRPPAALLHLGGREAPGENLSWGAGHQAGPPPPPGWPPGLSLFSAKSSLPSQGQASWATCPPGYVDPRPYRTGGPLARRSWVASLPNCERPLACWPSSLFQKAHPDLPEPEPHPDRGSSWPRRQRS